MKKVTFILFILSTYFIKVYSQDVKCNVTVNSKQVAQVEQSIFEALQKGIFEFVNNTSWTTHQYKEHEKIEMNIFINVIEQIKDGSGQAVADKYKGTITVQARRPVFGTTFYTQLFNYQDDKFEFTYQPFQQFFYAENTSMSNLTAVIAFYVYYCIGLDYDSFSPNGGEEYMIKAQNIVNQSQNLAESGWKSGDANSRFFLVTDYLNPAFKPLRELYYGYHRNGFDVMTTNLDQGRNETFNQLKNLDKIWNQRPNAFLLQVFFSAKRNEILDMLKATPVANKQEVINVLKKVDPSQGSKYDEANKEPS